MPGIIVFNYVKIFKNKLAAKLYAIQAQNSAANLTVL